MIQYSNLKPAENPCVCPNCGCDLRPFEGLAYGNVVVDDLGNIYFDGCPIELPRSQHLIVEALIKAKGRGLSRAFLATIVGGDIFDQTVSKYIERIRSSFRDIDPGFDQICSLRGFGAYRWTFRDSSLGEPGKPVAKVADSPP